MRMVRDLPKFKLAAIVLTLFALGLACTQLAPILAQQDSEDKDKQSELDREERLRKKRRFDRLAEEEQARLREFHRVLNADPKKEQLTRVMHAYEEWLKNLRPGERAELLSLPPDERIDMIRKILKEEANERLKRYARSSLTGKDAEVLNAWFADVIAKRSAELETRLTSKDRREIGGSENRKYFRLRMIWVQLPPTDMGLEEAEIADLQSKLSDKANAVIDEQSDSLKRDQMVKELINASRFSRNRGFGGFEVPEEELWKLYSSLDAKTRADLDGMSSGRMRGELFRLYFFRRRGPTGSFNGQRGGSNRGGSSRSGRGGEETRENPKDGAEPESQ